MQSFSDRLRTEVIWPSSDEDIDGESLSDDADDDEEKMKDLGLVNGSSMPGDFEASGAIQFRTCAATEREEKIIEELQGMKRGRSSGSADVFSSNSLEQFKRRCVALHTTDLGDGSIIYSQMLSGCTSFTETFNHCESQITRRLSMGLHKFYIGITGAPQFRWENPDFGHSLKHRRAHMHVLLKASADITRDVEISLVKHYHANIGTSFKILNAKNSPPGSLRENAHGEHFLYVIC